jgi:hypothetical protein
VDPADTRAAAGLPESSSQDAADDGGADDLVKTLPSEVPPDEALRRLLDVRAARPELFGGARARRPIALARSHAAGPG